MRAFILGGGARVDGKRGRGRSRKRVSGVQRGDGFVEAPNVL